MSKFNVGDQVIRYAFHSDKKVYTVTSISPCGKYIRFNGEPFGYHISNFQLHKAALTKPFDKSDYL